jgi:hypothetical protein
MFSEYGKWAKTLAQEQSILLLKSYMYFQEIDSLHYICGYLENVLTQALSG